MSDTPDPSSKPPRQYVPDNLNMFNTYQHNGPINAFGKIQKKSYTRQLIVDESYQEGSNRLE